MTRSMGALTAIVTVAMALLFWGFLRRPEGAELLAARPTTAAYDPITTRPSDEGDPGERAYLRYCSGCHGAAGDGKGPAAPFLFPPPRDFTRGLYKFTTRPAGSLPTDDDLLRTITAGLHGTSMPSWRFVPLYERLAVVEHLKTFLAPQEPGGPAGKELWRELETYERPLVPFHENLYDISDPDAVEDATAKGRHLYHKKVTCWQCHPAYMSREELEALIGNEVRAGIEKPVLKADAWGQEIPPADFPRMRLKSVRDLRDLYRVIAAGIGGTAMPSWKAALPADELWALTIYVDSLRERSSIRVERKDP